MSLGLGERLEALTGSGVAVDVRAIERELGSLWRHASAQGQSVARACLWNLVARSESDADHDRVKRLLDEIVAVCPARSLLLRAEPAGKGPELQAFISANCQLAPGGGKLLCSEEVTLRTLPSGEIHVPALVRALLVPDVPTALLSLGGAPPSTALVEALLPGADRLVVDSGAFASADALHALDALVPHLQHAELADLGWLRAEPLRLLLAGLFDPPIGALPLVQASHLRLRCSPRGAATAGLVLGWLCMRLGWRASGHRREGERRTWNALRDEGVTTLELDVDATAPSGAAPITEAVILSGGARFSVSSEGPGFMRVDAPGLPSRVVSAPEHPDAELLVASLGARGRDPQLLAALSAAGELFP